MSQPAVGGGTIEELIIDWLIFAIIINSLTYLPTWFFLRRVFQKGNWFYDKAYAVILIILTISLLVSVIYSLISCNFESYCY